VPHSVSFTDTSSGPPSSWLWDFGDGATSTEQHPVHVYTEVGTYTVSLTATNASGSDAETLVDYVQALPPAPVASFSSSAASGPVPHSVSFTDTSSGPPSSWLWDFGDGATSTEQHPVHVYTEVGTYTVSLTATNSTGSDVETGVDYVHVLPPPPVASFSSSAASGVVPHSVSFTDTSSGTPTSWLWDFGDGATSTEQNPVHVYTVVGTYTVSLTATNAGGSDAESLVDYIQALPAAPVASFGSSATSGPAPHSVSFTDTSSGPPSSWLWDFGDGATSTEQHPVHVYMEMGTYTVSLTATNVSGSDAETLADYVLVLEPLPVASFSSSATTGSVPHFVQFTDTSSGSPSSWLWDFGDGATSAEQNAGHVYTAVGRYTVSLTVTNSSGSDMVTLVDHVLARNPKPRRWPPPQGIGARSGRSAPAPQASPPASKDG